MAKKLSAGLAFVNVASDDPAQTSDLFEALFGIDFVPALWDEDSYHAPISQDGIDLNVNVRHAPQETTVPYFDVDDLDSAVSTVQSKGGDVVWGPQDVKIPDADLPEYKKAIKGIDNVDVANGSMGRAVIVSVPGGSHIGLIEVADHAERHFRAGRQRSPLSDYQDTVHRRSKDVAGKRGRGRRGGRR